MLPGLVVEPVIGPFADAVDMGADGGQRADEFALVGGKGGLDEEDVNGALRFWDSRGPPG